MPETESITPEPTTPELHSYYFTFGADHLGGRGFRRYMVVQAESATHARQLMTAKHGTAWAFQYTSPEAVELDKYNLQEVDFRTGEDKLTLDLLRDAALDMETANPEWMERYRRWLATR